MAAILNRGQTVGKIERGPPNYHLGQICGLNWFSGLRGEDVNVIFY